MTKREIIIRLAKRTGLDQRQATQAVEGVIGIIADALAGGRTIHIRGFASLTVVDRKPRHARDMRNGINITMPAFRQVKIKAYPTLKNRINEIQSS